MMNRALIAACMLPILGGAPVAVAQPTFQIITPVRMAPSGGRDADLAQFQEVDVQHDAHEALKQHGCAASAKGGSDVGVLTVEASIRKPRHDEDVLLDCVYFVELKDASGAEVYKEQLLTDNSLCSIPWLKQEVRRHTARACQLAVAADTRAGRGTAPSGYIAPSVLTAAGVVAVAIGAERLASNGERRDCIGGSQSCVERLNSSGVGFGWIVAGGALVAAGGAWLFYELFKTPSPVEVSLGASSISVGGKF